MGREVGMGWELPAWVLPPPSEMDASAVSGCPEINNGSSTCQEVVGREEATTEIE